MSSTNEYFFGSVVVPYPSLNPIVTHSLSVSFIIFLSISKPRLFISVAVVQLRITLPACEVAVNDVNSTGTGKGSGCS